MATLRTLAAHFAAALFLAAGPAAAQVASPHAIDIPRWFSETFLDFKEDIAEAARSNRRLLVYFGQDGCPYCKALMQANFRQPAIEAKTRRHFVAVAINIWGDREVTWIDGRRMTEKEFARFLHVQFTPTLLFLDTDGRTLLRLNGYQPPERFDPVLDFVIQRRDKTESLAEYLKDKVKEPAAVPRDDPPYLLRPPYDLRRRSGARPLAVMFEARSCAACDEMHREALARPALRKLLERFDVVRLYAADTGTLVAPDGRTLTAQAWARELRVDFTPTVVFFDPAAREVFRFDSYLRPFHIESAFDYVASAAYRGEPQFQRYIQRRADRLRDAGQAPDLWR